MTLAGAGHTELTGVRTDLIPIGHAHPPVRIWPEWGQILAGGGVRIWLQNQEIGTRKGTGEYTPYPSRGNLDQGCRRFDPELRTRIGGTRHHLDMLDLLFTGTPPPSPSDLPEDRRIWIDYARMLEFISSMLELARQPPSQPGAGR